MYAGKQFEEDFKNSFSEYDALSLVRLYDVKTGYYGVKNPCDFVWSIPPHTVYLELKVTKGDRLPFDQFSDFQWTQLTLRNAVKGQKAGALVCYADHKIVVWVPSNVLQQVKSLGQKSIHFKDACRYGKCPIVNWKRTRLSIELDSLKSAIASYKFHPFTEVMVRGVNAEVGQL